MDTKHVKQIIKETMAEKKKRQLPESRYRILHRSLRRPTKTKR